MPPFAWIHGRLWVVANWTDDLNEDDWLLLRPASRREIRICFQVLSDPQAEAFYSCVLSDEDRLSGR